MPDEFGLHRISERFPIQTSVEQKQLLNNGNYSAIVVKKVQTNSEQKANANPIVDAVG